MSQHGKRSRLHDHLIFGGCQDGKLVNGEIYTSFARVNSLCHAGGQKCPKTEAAMMPRTSDRLTFTRWELSKTFVCRSLAKVATPIRTGQAQAKRTRQHCRGIRLV